MIAIVIVIFIVIVMTIVITTFIIEVEEEGPARRAGLWGGMKMGG